LLRCCDDKFIRTSFKKQPFAINKGLFCYLLGAGGAGGGGGGARWRGGAQPVLIMANIAINNTTIASNKPVNFVFMAMYFCLATVGMLYCFNRPVSAGKSLQNHVENYLALTVSSFGKTRFSGGRARYIL